MAEVAAYAGQWHSGPHSGCRRVCRELGQIAHDWAKTLQDELNVEDCAPEHQQQEQATKRALWLASQRHKCSVFAMLAIVSYMGTAELSKEDAQQLCNLSVWAERNRILRQVTPFDRAVRELTLITQDVLAVRLAELVSFIDQDPSMLTDSVRLVLDITPGLDESAESLQWRPISYDLCKTSCFEAEDGTGNLYSVNLLNGIVLFNGTQQGRLPESIRRHPLYRRCFGDRNFEIVRKRSQIPGRNLTLTTVKSETVRNIKGCKYTFVLQSSGRLIVEEVHPDNDGCPLILELLDGTDENVGDWGSELPVRLQKMHSHWICRSPPPEIAANWRKMMQNEPKSMHPGEEQQEFVLLRPVDFSQRTIHFLLYHRRKSGEGPDCWTCFRVPNHLQCQSTAGHADVITDKILSLQSHLVDLDRLVLPLQPTLEVLAKFEKTKFIHAFQGAQERNQQPSKGTEPEPSFDIVEFPRSVITPFRLACPIH